MKKQDKPAFAAKLLIGAAMIDKAIASIKLRSAKITQDIQLAGLSIIQHVDEHGDTTLADRLYHAMGKGQRRSSLAMWFITYGKMRVLDRSNGDDALAIKAGRVFAFDKARNTDMPGAEVKQWHEMQKEEDVSKVFDVHAAYINLMRRIQAAQKDGTKLENAEWIEKLAELGLAAPV